MKAIKKARLTKSLVESDLFSIYLETTENRTLEIEVGEGWLKRTGFDIHTLRLFEGLPVSAVEALIDKLDRLSQEVDALISQRATEQTGWAEKEKRALADLAQIEHFEDFMKSPSNNFLRYLGLELKFSWSSEEEPLKWRAWEFTPTTEGNTRVRIGHTGDIDVHFEYTKPCDLDISWKVLMSILHPVKMTSRFSEPSSVFSLANCSVSEDLIYITERREGVTL